MSEIINSLNKVSARLSEEAFLSNKGLSNEVGIHVFCYDPKDELTVRAYFDILKKQQDVPYNLIERDLYKIFLEIVSLLLHPLHRHIKACFLFLGYTYSSAVHYPPDMHFLTWKQLPNIKL